MTDLQLTEDERVELSAFAKSAAYRKLSEYAVEGARKLCENPSDRTLYHQGMVGGVRQFCKLIETCCNPPAAVVGLAGEVFDKFRSVSGRKA